MDKKLIDSMNGQMAPSPQVRAALMERLAQAPKRRRGPARRYIALAACAALVIGAFPLYRALRPGPGARPLHSYVTVEGPASHFYATEDALTGGEGIGGDAGDQDMDMAPEDLASAMLEVGYTQEEIDEYQSTGYQMTWAKWWKFVHEQENSEGDEPFTLEGLKIFSQKELYVNTGALPGGAYVGDIPVQEGAEDYQLLMAHFNGTYPDWYGGAYLDSSGRLVVQLVEDKDPGDKSLELQVLDWTGSDSVMFSSCKYSLTRLKELMDRLNALPDSDPVCRDVMVGWGVDEEANRIELTLTEVNDQVLSILAQLDPEDDAIYVQVGQRAVADVDSQDPAVIGEDPAVHHAVPGGTTVPDDGDLIADEPWVDEDMDGAHYDVADLPRELPQQKLPGAVQSVPEEDTSSAAPCSPRQGS